MEQSLSASRATAGTRARAAIGLSSLVVTVVMMCGAEGGTTPDFDAIAGQARGLARNAWLLYESTPPADRVAWGGLAAAAVFGLGVVLERLFVLRRMRIIPAEFAARFVGRLQEGRLDRGKALDYCELNPSPASRVALAAVKRWGRPVADLERASALAYRLEAEGLRRNVGTLRRLAALSPLIGLLGTLVAASRALSALGVADNSGPAWGPALATALGPLIAGVAIGILALVAYDGLVARVEALAAALDRVAAETIDAVAMALPPDLRPGAPGGPARTPHQIRVEIPSLGSNVGESEEDHA